jgi:basic membrane lipoprotein Med (substrate-binding protein (PBP1-ABC) superfamily)
LNFYYYLSDEITRQLIDSDVKVIFGLSIMSAVLEKAVENSKKPIKIVYIKQSQSDALPRERINFHELIETNGRYF